MFEGNVGGAQLGDTAADSAETDLGGVQPALFKSQ